jgi:hypothetical protein
MEYEQFVHPAKKCMLGAKTPAKRSTRAKSKPRKTPAGPLKPKQPSSPLQHNDENTRRHTNTTPCEAKELVATPKPSRSRAKKLKPQTLIDSNGDFAFIEAWTLEQRAARVNDIVALIETCKCSRQEPCSDRSEELKVCLVPVLNHVHSSKITSR